SAGPRFETCFKSFRWTLFLMESPLVCVLVQRKARSSVCWSNGPDTTQGQGIAFRARCNRKNKLSYCGERRAYQALGESPTPKKHCGVPPKIHTRPRSEHTARPVRKGGGDERVPPVLNRTRPHALNMGGGCFGGGSALWGPSTPKAPCPNVDEDKGHFLTTLAVGCRVCGRGAYRNLGAPYNKRAPRSRPPTL
ncbi:hypothetical protein AB205_0028850, partial [Aquarana catesbeiana]